MPKKTKTKPLLLWRKHQTSILNVLSLQHMMNLNDEFTKATEQNKDCCWNLSSEAVPSSTCETRWVLINPFKNACFQLWKEALDEIRGLHTLSIDAQLYRTGPAHQPSLVALIVKTLTCRCVCVCVCCTEVPTTPTMAEWRGGLFTPLLRSAVAALTGWQEETRRGCGGQENTGCAGGNRLSLPLSGLQSGPLIETQRVDAQGSDDECLYLLNTSDC